MNKKYNKKRDNERVRFGITGKSYWIKINLIIPLKVMLYPFYKRKVSLCIQKVGKFSYLSLLSLQLSPVFIGDWLIHSGLESCSHHSGRPPIGSDQFVLTHQALRLQHFSNLHPIPPSKLFVCSLNTCTPFLDKAYSLFFFLLYLLKGSASH